MRGFVQVSESRRQAIKRAQVAAVRLAADPSPRTRDAIRMHLDIVNDRNGFDRAYSSDAEAWDSVQWLESMARNRGLAPN